MTVGEAVSAVGEWLWNLELATLATGAGLLVVALVGIGVALSGALHLVWLARRGAPIDRGLFGDAMAGLGCALVAGWVIVDYIVGG